MVKRNKLSLFFSVYIPLIPILQYYKSLIPVLNFATFLSLVFLVVFLVDSSFRKRNIVKGFWPIYVYAIYIVLNSLFNENLDLFGSATALLPLLRCLLLIISLAYFGKDYFDREMAVGVLEKILILSSILTLFSTALYYASGVSVRFNIPFLLTDSGYSAPTNRFSGIYMEPAHFAQSAVIYLCYSLFNGKKIARNKIVAISTVVIGILLSGSGQGYVYLLAILLLYLFYLMFIDKRNKSKFLTISVVLMACSLGLLILSGTPFFQNAVGRMISSDGSIGGEALNGRTFSNKLFDELSNKQKWFGVGFANISTIYSGYFNSLYMHLIETGYISVVLLFLIPVYSFLKGDYRIKCLSIIYASMIVISACASPMMLCYFLLFIAPNRRLDKRTNTAPQVLTHRRLLYD